ncbi:hypothetical protein WBV54_09675 [Acinetobacter baumannii]
MAQVMIMVSQADRVENTCNLLAEISKNGEVTNLYDCNGNELKINFLRNEVYFKKLWWEFNPKVE